jgi:hypothetical protein
MLARWVFLAALGISISVLALAAVVGPGWLAELPRAARREIIEIFLRVVFILFAALAVTSLAAVPLLGWLSLRARRARLSRPRLKRAFLLSLSCLFAVGFAELVAARWRAWMHRLPRLPVKFAPAPPEEYRIVVLGGSSALGEPYRPWLSVGQIVAWQLQQAIPNRRFECENLAWLGETLEQQHQKLASIKRRPHALIIYSGHNEFAARFGEEHESRTEEIADSALLSSAYRLSLSSRFCRLVDELRNKNQIDTPPLSGRHRLIDPPVCRREASAEILGDFSARLEAIVTYCDQIGALPILIIPPANESGYEPSRSTLSTEVSQRERERLASEFWKARAEEARVPEASAARYRAILTGQPDFAEAHFRLARILESTGQTTDAARHYLAALDHDGLPVRCQAPFRAAYEVVAARHASAILIDGRRELSAVSPDGLIGDEVIQDTHHPTLRGYTALAGAVLRELLGRRVFRQAGPLELPLDPTACAEHFAIDAERWAAVCERTSVHFRRVAGYRYDPTARLEQARRYAEAEARIRGGTSPEDVGLPGIGTKKRKVRTR